MKYYMKKLTKQWRAIFPGIQEWRIVSCSSITGMFTDT